MKHITHIPHRVNRRKRTYFEFGLENGKELIAQLRTLEAALLDDVPADEDCEEGSSRRAGAGEDLLADA